MESLGWLFGIAIAGFIVWVIVKGNWEYDEKRNMKRIADALEELVKLQMAARPSQPPAGEQTEKGEGLGKGEGGDRSNLGNLSDFSRVGMLRKPKS